MPSWTVQADSLLHDVEGGFDRGKITAQFTAVTVSSEPEAALEEALGQASVSDDGDDVTLDGPDGPVVTLTRVAGHEIRPAAGRRQGGQAGASHELGPFLLTVGEQPEEQ